MIFTPRLFLGLYVLFLINKSSLFKSGSDQGFVHVSLSVRRHQPLLYERSLSNICSVFYSIFFFFLLSFGHIVFLALIAQKLLWNASIFTRVNAACRVQRHILCAGHFRPADSLNCSSKAATLNHDANSCKKTKERSQNKKWKWTLNLYVAPTNIISS